jgi:hypothetical protein
MLSLRLEPVPVLQYQMKQQEPPSSPGNGPVCDNCLKTIVYVCESHITWAHFGLLLPYSFSSQLKIYYLYNNVLDSG